ncbi:MAG: BMC domain-containing protein [Phycisphaerae bacterium]
MAQDALGMIELTSVAIGHLVHDAMLKAANVRSFMARTICSGKYIVLVGGTISATRAAVDAGLAAAPDGVIDHLLIGSLHPQVFQALGEMVQLGASSEKTIPSLGIIETFSASSALEAADAAVKAANVTLFRIHLAMALGGKGFIMFAGTVADCTAALDAGAAVVKQKGLLVATALIPRPSPELFADRL